MAQQLAKNTLFLTGASIVQKALAFVYFLVVARFLSPAETGQYFLALSITTMFSVIADIGVTQVVIRQVAKTPGEAPRLLREALGVKLPFLVVACAGSLLLTVALNYSPLILILVATACLVMIADALSLLWYGALRGMQALQYESIGMFVGQSFTLLVGGTILFLQPSVQALIAALIAGSVFNAVFSASHVYRRLGAQIFRPIFTKSALVQLVRLAFPFALAGVFVKIYSSFDALLLSKWVGDTAVGVYALAYKLTYAFQFLPLAFVASLYPAMSHASQEEPEKLEELFCNGMWYMALLAAPLTFGLWAVAAPVVALVGPAYGDAVQVLQILIFVSLPLFLDYPIGSLLNATGRAHMKTALMGVSMVANIVLNIVLIPLFGPEGAAIAAVASFSLLFILGLFTVPKSIPSFHFSKLWKTVSGPVLSGAIMGIVVMEVLPWFLRILPGSLALLAAVLLGGIVYVLLLILTRSLTKAHWVRARQLLSRSRV